jgi:F-type H+-transporting ATPase subunit f
MARIAKFYERLPKGPMPEIKPRGLLERYQHRYFGHNPSAARKSHAPALQHWVVVSDCILLIAIWHVIFSIMALSYGMEYYFHLSMSSKLLTILGGILTATGHHKNNAH